MEQTKLPANIPAWFVEFFQRFALKTPKFFQVLQTAGIFVAWLMVYLKSL